MRVNFPEHTQNTLAAAWDEACRRGSKCITPEHLLLGLVRQPTCNAIHILTALGADHRDVERALKIQLPEATSHERDPRTFSPESVAVLTYALAESQALRRHEIDTDQVLMGLLLQSGTFAAQLLTSLDVTAETARNEALKLRRIRPDSAFPIPDASVLRGPLAEQVCRLLNCHCNHLPPLSETGRKVRTLLSYATPLMLVLSVVLLRTTESPLGAQRFSFSLSISIIFIPLFAWLLFLLLFRLQAHLFELMLILPVCSLPVGIAARSNQEMDEIGLATVVLGVLLLSGGSIWGLSVSQRSGEKRTWPRLGWIVIGWGMCSGVYVWLVLGCCSASGQFPSGIWPRVLMGLLLLCTATGAIAEYVCQRKYGPMRAW